jgi:hypothetical protein
VDEMKPWLKWPPGCAPGKYFPGAGPLTLSQETRKFATMKAAAGGTNVIRAALGIPLRGGTDHELGRSSASVDVELWSFFRAHKRRPTQTDLPALDLWLRRCRKSSISRRCDELDFPALIVSDRTDRTVNAELRRFFREHKKRPSGRDLPAINKWLEQRDSSLPERCDELGFPQIVTRRTDREVNAELRSFVRTNKRRPTASDLNAIQKWLQRRGSSVSQRCHELFDKSV